MTPLGGDKKGAALVTPPPRTQFRERWKFDPQRSWKQVLDLIESPRDEEFLERTLQRCKKRRVRLRSVSEVWKQFVQVSNESRLFQREIEEIASHSGVSKTTAEQAVKVLNDLGVIRRLERASRDFPPLWRVEFDPMNPAWKARRKRFAPGERVVPRVSIRKRRRKERDLEALRPAQPPANPVQTNYWGLLGPEVPPEGLGGSPPPKSTPQEDEPDSMACSDTGPNTRPESPKRIYGYAPEVQRSSGQRVSPSSLRDSVDTPPARVGAREGDLLGQDLVQQLEEVARRDGWPVLPTLRSIESMLRKEPEPDAMRDLVRSVLGEARDKGRVRSLPGLVRWRTQHTSELQELEASRREKKRLQLQGRTDVSICPNCRRTGLIFVPSTTPGARQFGGPESKHWIVDCARCDGMGVLAP